ncbi:CDP-glycerol--glycerophosphate glycerophosphotransferase [Vibrio breoganii]|nr:CDP-glycerol--glycerophosphate glycerophosphotransferase [Vibrio breoganii]
MGKRYLMYIAQNYSYAILRPLQTEIVRQGGEVRWFLEGDEVDGRYLKSNEVQLESVRAVKQWKPDAVFVPGNVVPNFIPGVKVAVFHGFNAGKVNRRGRLDHFEIRDCFDLYCTQGPETTVPFLKLAEEHGYFRVVETGWPALDPLFNADHSISNNDEIKTRPTVLMCSTFSRNLSCAPRLFDTIRRLSSDSKWSWLVQFHPKMPLDIVNKYKSIQNENLRFVETDDVIPLLRSADVMLCDTSSILLMFLLQHKPVVTFNNQNPLPHLLNVTDEKEVEGALDKALSLPSDLMGEIKNFSEHIHPYADGKSSARVLAATNELVDNKKGLKRKPINLIRGLKMRKKLGYWRL